MQLLPAMSHGIFASLSPVFDMCPGRTDTPVPAKSSLLLLCSGDGILATSAAEPGGIYFSALVYDSIVPQGSLLDSNRILCPRQEAGRTGCVYCPAVRAAPTLYPQTSRKSKEIAQYKSVSPDPPATTLWTAAWFFPPKMFGMGLNFL